MTEPKPELTFWEHLDELRSRVFVSLGALTAATAAGWTVSDRALSLFTEPLRANGTPVYFFSPQGAFVARVQVSLLLGVFLSAPVLLHQLWGFVSPALHRHEKRAAVPLVAVMSALFAAGAAFAWFGVVPVALRFLVGMQTESLQPMISLEEYVSFLSGFLISFGVAFNLPVFVLAFVASGVVDASGLSRLRRHAIVLIFILAAVLTPGPDVASQLLLAVPLWGLFEISVAAAWLFGVVRARRRRAAAGQGGPS
ncbi:MAG TPA: twin-arginine translocase subunit TatC [Candidatus Eisenbacteria bacterium]|jgi:sec-independent protein translocase protein TatC|nr:twin-arginine translocase subunit TatC [Candidatus Eisenbacteria bacterium]